MNVKFRIKGNLVGKLLIKSARIFLKTKSSLSVTFANWVIAEVTENTKRYFKLELIDKPGES